MPSALSPAGGGGGLDLERAAVAITSLPPDLADDAVVGAVLAAALLSRRCDAGSGGGGGVRSAGRPGDAAAARVGGAAGSTAVAGWEDRPAAVIAMAVSALSATLKDASHQFAHAAQ